MATANQTVSNSGNPVVTRAWSEADFEQIHRLNHRTFAQEIPQHAPRADGLLVDPRQDRSTFFVAKRDTRIVGMLAVSHNRPFSLDDKLPDLDALLPSDIRDQREGRICEVRLLAIEPEERGGPLLSRLLARLLAFGRAHGYGAAVISATTTQLRLYRHIGFEAFGPALGTKAAPYQGMVVSWSRLSKVVESLDSNSRLDQRSAAGDTHQNYLPGPVAIHPEVQQALAEPPISHRGTEFRELFRSCRERLRSLTGASSVHVVQGSGTTANDVVAAQLRLLGQRGLVVRSGEFGRRLVQHARGADLDFDVFDAAYGDDLDYERLDAKFAELARDGSAWLWATHCETSSGVLHDHRRLTEIAKTRGGVLALDCISSLGVASSEGVQLNLERVDFASGSSGKALASFCGLGLVFTSGKARNHDRPLQPALDLGAYRATDGVPYTISPNLVRALERALERLEHGGDATQAARIEASRSIRQGFVQRGFELVAARRVTSPAVLTLRLPEALNSVSLGRTLEQRGIHSSYRSEYQRQRNEVQFCLMSEALPDRWRDLPEVVASAAADLRACSAGSTRPRRRA